MRKEREALQSTVQSYRRTMAATSSLTKGNHGLDPLLDGDETDIQNGGGGGDVMVRSVLQVYESNAIDYMTSSMRSWCQKREKDHGRVCTALQVSEPTIGQDIVLCETDMD